MEQSRDIIYGNIDTIVGQLSNLLGIDFVQDTDTDYIDIDSKLIGKANTFSCNTFTRSKYGDVFMSLNDITHKAKVLVNSIENFTK